MALINTIEFANIGDERGDLVSLEQNRNIPFDIKRIYYLFGTKINIGRGFHAHKSLKQVALCVKGSCRFTLDDGYERESIVLNRPTLGLYIDNNKWREMDSFTDDCVLLVIANNFYDEADYIRDYQTFKNMVVF